MDEAARQAQREYTRQYRQANKERIKQRAREYYLENKEKVHAQQKAWKQANPDKVRAQTERYWQKKAAQAGHVCLYCKQSFEPKRSDAKFCSTRCRVSHNRNK